MEFRRGLFRSSVMLGVESRSAPCRARHVSRSGATHMKFFDDTADTAEIRDLAESGLVDGVTTNPSLIHKSGRKFLEVVAEICSITSGPVSAEVVALAHETMMTEPDLLRKIAEKVANTLPLTKQ